MNRIGNMMERNCKLIVAVAIMLVYMTGVASADGTERQITTNVNNQLSPAMDNNIIVWTDNRNGNQDIYMYGLIRNTERQITTNVADQYEPAVDENRIVWTDTRNGNRDIYMYELRTHTEKQITTDLADQVSPDISGDRIVWQDSRNGNEDIYMYDLTTNTERRITTDPGGQFGPRIDGDYIVWEDSRNGNSDIYMYDLSTNTERQITANPAIQYDPVIDMKKIVYVNFENGVYDIRMYDLTTNTDTQITNDVANQYTPAIDDHRIVWRDDRNGNQDIYMYDLSTNTETQITANIADDWEPDINGNHIIWTDTRNGNTDIYMYSILPGPPSVNQHLSAKDTIVTNLLEYNCRECHRAGVPSRHHNLAVQGKINPINGQPFRCNDCHPIMNGFVLLDRNCMDCHSGVAFKANNNVNPGKPHHKTINARNRDCKFCHGGFIDNFNDGHFIPNFPIDQITPDPKYKVENPISGKKWGGCESCHESDPKAELPILDNSNNHHSIIEDSGAQCSWCHGIEGMPDFRTIRACEDCHSESTLHNIELNFPVNNGQKGWGHIGDTWDCNGCHADWVAGDASSIEGAIIPEITSITPTKLDSNTSTTVAIDGVDFLSGTGTFTADVVIDNTTFVPNSVTDNQIKVDVNLIAGVHTIKVVKKGDIVPKPTKLATLIVVDPVNITNAKITKKAGTTEITIIGTGFGPKPEELLDPLFTSHGIWITSSNGKIVQATVNSWNETKIVASTPKANIVNLVTVKALNGDDTENIS